MEQLPVAGLSMPSLSKRRADALELNIFYLPTASSLTSAQVETATLKL